VQLVKGHAEKWLTFYSVPWNELPVSTTWISIALFLAGIIITSAYPILVSFSNRSMLVVKKNWSYRSPQWINIIVTAQYSTAIVLLILIICVYFQLNLILSKPIGIEKDGVIAIDCPLQQRDNFITRLDYFVSKAQTIEGIDAATISKNVAGDWVGYGVPLQRIRNEIEFGLDTNGGVDENFLDVFGIKLLHGRNFQRGMPADRNAILVSRYATARLGFSTPEEALGAKLILPWYGNEDVEVIGVYEDYEFQPFLLNYNHGPRGSFLSYGNSMMPDYFPSKISVRTTYEELESSLKALEDLFEETFPQDTFRWTFVDENIQKHYTTEKVARNQIGVFTLIAIGIACLGLLGLISNKVVEKVKEIGIRKVLGAELHHIVRLLLNTTMQQILIAAAISIPLAYYLAKLYLEKFSERITLQWWHFAFPLVALVVIMFGTIATIVWKAARSNPVEALKYE
jgi:putative ABC transport system permease protein